MSTTQSPPVNDKGVIPGMHKYCDQWCTYCHMTARCVVQRCLRAWQERHGTDRFSAFADVIAFTREVAAAEGEQTPELDALLSPDPAVRASVPALNDPLERLACAYASETTSFLLSSGWMPPVESPRQPSPIDVVAWYHVFTATRVTRALTSGAQAARGQANRLTDANGTAKVALIGIDRSRTALRRLGAQYDPAEVGRLLEMLDRLASGLEARFPAARDFMRPGLDAAVV